MISMLDKNNATQLLTVLGRRGLLHRVVNWHISRELSLVFEVEHGFDLADCTKLRDVLDSTKLDLYITRTYYVAPVGWSGPQWGHFPVRLPAINLHGFWRPPLVLGMRPIRTFDGPIKAEVDLKIIDLLARLKISKFEFANTTRTDYGTPAVFFATEDDSVLFKMAL